MIDKVDDWLGDKKYDAKNESHVEETSELGLVQGR